MKASQLTKRAIRSKEALVALAQLDGVFVPVEVLRTEAVASKLVCGVVVRSVIEGHIADGAAHSVARAVRWTRT